MSQPMNALKASNQKADIDSYGPSPTSPGCMELAIIPLPLARNTARCGADDGRYGTLGWGP